MPDQKPTLEYARRNRILGCSRGSGVPPRYVQRFIPREGGIELCLAGLDPPTPSFICSSEEELRRKCREFAEQRLSFSIGGREGRGPADLMSEWQQAGLMPVSFLQISWTAAEEWQVHEMMPGVQQWDIRPIGELLASRPQEPDPPSR
jgi:hypothetical protein